MAAILGVLLLGVGYWAHHRTEKRQ
jgi:hypothetical protein